MNRSNLSFNTRFAIAAFFSVATCLLIAYIMHLVFDMDAYVPVMVTPVTLLFINYKRMKNNYQNKDHD